jgi:uracil-DNA glycosylase
VDEIVRGPVEGANCADCPFAKNGQPNRPVRGVGPANPDFLVIGEGPGQTEVRQGLPLVGPTGELLNKGLKETGTDRSRLYLGNVTLCIPPPKSDEKLKHQAAACCRPRLLTELAMFPGKPVLALGGVAAKSLVGSKTDLPITEIAGAHFSCDIDNTGARSVIPTVHPAAILRGGDDKGPEKTGSHVTDLGFWSLKWDILKTKALAARKDIHLRMRLDKEIFVELNDPYRARELVRDRIAAAQRTGRIAIDYETYVDNPERNNALQAFIAKIKLLGLASDGRACSVSWDLLGRSTVYQYAKVLADPEITKEYHNKTYDEAVSQNQHYGFKLGGVADDTLLGQHAAWPGAKKKLQHVVCQYRAVDPWKSEFRKRGEGTLAEEAIYNAKDVLSTHMTVGPTHFWIKKQGVQKVYDVDRVKSDFAVQMHLRGYYVDPDVNDEIKSRLTKVIDAANEMMIGRYRDLADQVHERLASEQAKTHRKKDPDSYSERIEVRKVELLKLISKDRFEFSPSNSNHAVALLQACGVPLWETTKSGKKIASGGDILEKFSHYPEADELIQLRSNEQLKKTFIVRMFEWVEDSNGNWLPPHVQDDGRCHALWGPTQISGRFGSTAPASSNWSEGDETNKDPRKRLPNIRRQLVAPPGRAIVAFDYEQLEARLMAVMSGDPFLCQIFRDGKDIHHEFGLFPFPQMGYLDKKSEEYVKLRNLTKRFEYGAIYGASNQKVHKAVSADEPSLANAQGLKMITAAITKMKQAIPGVFAWQRRLLEETSQPPYTLRSYLNGRTRIFPLGNPPATDIANNPNQFAGADIIDNGLCRFLPKLVKFRDAFGILHQHDACFFECDEDEVMDVARDVYAAFPTSIRAVDGKDIDFPIEVKVGFAYNMEASDKQKLEHPQLVWPVGRPGLTKVKLQNV